MVKKRKSTNQQISLFSIIETNAEARDTLRTMLKVGNQNKEVWRGLIATPPGSLLEKVVGAFRSETDIPLEIPFFVTLTYISAELLKRGVAIDFCGQNVRPDLWTIILGDSGCGKTYASSQIGKAISGPDSIPEPSTAVRFIQNLVEHNRGLWIRDEFAQFLHSLDSQSYLQEMKDYLLRVYDGKKIERNTKKESLFVEDPALVILGMAVSSTFQKYVSAESMLDGFAQRFQYVLANRDPERKAEDYPIYNLRDWYSKIGDEWTSLWEQKIYGEYVVSKCGEEAFRTSFSLLMPPKCDLPMSFYRRILFRGVKYALLYHLLLHKNGNQIDANDMGWAGRVIGIHIKDAMWLIREHSSSDLERVLQAAERIKLRMEKRGEKCKPRDLVAGVKGIKSASEARGILSIL